VHAFFSLLLGAIMMGGLAPWLSASMARLAVSALLVNFAGYLVWRSALRQRRRSGI
jgi:hypothetical protein